MNARRRIRSIDVFRGLTIALMIVVNTPGSWSYVYAPLRHAEWHGWTPTDLVFPFFLFIMGVSMAFSFSKFGYRWSRDTARKVVRRTILLILIGWALRMVPPWQVDWSHFRISGVLQRIALVYFFTALLITHIHRRTILYVVGAIILLAYWWVLAAFGGADPYGPQTNIVRKIDLMLLGEQHMWHGLGFAFDPEGILSTFPAVVTALSGYLYGMELKAHRPVDGNFIVRSLAAALGLIAAAYLWHEWMPINKSLWTSSYVLFTSGMAIAVLALCIYWIDVRGWTRGIWVLEVFGRNALSGFVLSIFLVRVMLYVVRWDVDGQTVSLYKYLFDRVFAPLLGPYPGSLAFALSFTVLCWLLLYPLYRKGVYIKL